MAFSPRRKRLVSATTAAISVCAVLPSTGPWARRTITGMVRAVVNPPIPNDGSDDTEYWTQRAQAFRIQTERDHSAAAFMPTDFPVQLAACIGSVPDDYDRYEINDDGTVRQLTDAEFIARSEHGDSRNERIAQKLRTLAPRFDQNPTYHAAILRYLSAGAVSLNNRGDEAILYDAEKVKGIRSQTARTPPPTPEAVAMWHTDAQAGARLEPQNAFFPFMEAIACFVEHHDTDALDALHRASTKSDYNDHALEEADGIARLRAAEGEPLTAMERVMALQDVCLPHYSVMRACARLAVAQAVEAELQNRTEDGFRIRRDVRRIGSNLRQNAPTAIGSQVSSSITCSTSMRPGGAPPEKLTTSASAPPPDSGERGVDEKEIRERARNERYETYLRRIKHTDEAQAYAAEIIAQKNNQRLVEQISDNPNYYFYLPRLFLLQVLPLLARLMLMNALFLLFLGFIAQRLARTRRIASAEPLPRAVRIGITSAFVLPLAGTLLVVGVDEFWAFAGPELSLVGALSCGIVAVLVRCLLMRRARSAQSRAVPVSRPSLLKRCRAAGVRGVGRTVGLWTLGAVCAGLVAAFFGFVGNWFIDIALNAVGDGEISAFELVTENAQLTTFWAFAFCLLGAPSLLLLFFAACSPKVGVPALAGMVRGMRGVAVPVACCLVLLTVPLFVWLARADAALNRDINRAMQNENRYIAEISGRLWPLHKGPPAPQ